MLTCGTILIMNLCRLILWAVPLSAFRFPAALVSWCCFAECMDRLCARSTLYTVGPFLLFWAYGQITVLLCSLHCFWSSQRLPALEFLYCSMYGVKSAPLVSSAWVLLILPPWKVIRSYSLWNLSIYIPSSDVRGKCLVFSHFKDKHMGTHFMSAISLLNTFLGLCFDDGKNCVTENLQSLQLELGCHAFFVTLL